MTIISTRNSFGWTSNIPNQITVAFLDFLSEEGAASSTALDIGCGFGVATIPALKTGATVIANDLDAGHLAAVQAEAEAFGLSERLTISPGRFPDDLGYADLTAIHSSNVLHFLKGEEIERGAREMYSWLRTGGKVFIQVGTIYAGHIKALVPVFDSNVRRGLKWPGEVENANEFVLEQFRTAIPDRMNFLTAEPLVEAFGDAGFEIEQAWYYTRTGLEPPLTNDGREHFGLVARKPK